MFGRFWQQSFVLVWLLLVAALPGTAHADHLTDYISKVTAGDIVPGADRLGPLEGHPSAMPAYAGQKLLGWIFLNTDVAPAMGYSGKPIRILIGLTKDGKIAGAKLMEHHEPIVLIGIPPARINAFINGYIGQDVSGISAISERPPVDIVSGATVTVMVIGDSIMRSARRMARLHAPGGASVVAAAPARQIDPAAGTVEDWAALVKDGSVHRLHLTVGQVSDAFAHAGHQDAAVRPETDDSNSDFIDMYTAPVSVPAIGRSLLGQVGYDHMRSLLKPGQQAIAVFSQGAYSFKGSGYVRGGIFDRFTVVQGDQSIRFRDINHTRLGNAAAVGAPDFVEADLFVVPNGMKLDPAAPWRLQLLAQRATTGRDKAFLTFDLAYDLPEKYLAPLPKAPPPQAEQAEPAPPPLWHVMWRADAGKVVVLSIAILVLTAIFFFQDWFARHPVLYDRVRLGFLTFSLVWIGWYAQAQLSVVNVLAFLSALRSDFSWDYFLMAPLIFILWFATAASMLFWNRGAFCGWLCPFGAMQELANRGARRIGIRQLKIPFGLHQRLAAIKYVVFLVLFGISLSALGTAEKAAEVEPFKTAIVLHFLRSWPFVLYAVALLAASLFVDRFFCRYLCPLGAALAIPARLRLFDWLRRYRECGSPCQRCGNECPVQAIHPEGHINPSECIQCLHCQMLYHHDRMCPVMIQRRLKREKYLASAPPPQPPRPAPKRPIPAPVE